MKSDTVGQNFHLFNSPTDQNVSDSAFKKQLDILMMTNYAKYIQPTPFNLYMYVFSEFLCGFL